MKEKIFVYTLLFTILILYKYIMTKDVERGVSNSVMSMRDFLRAKLIHITLVFTCLIVLSFTYEHQRQPRDALSIVEEAYDPIFIEANTISSIRSLWVDKKCTNRVTSDFIIPETAANKFKANQNIREIGKIARGILLQGDMFCIPLKCLSDHYDQNILFTRNDTLINPGIRVPDDAYFVKVEEVDIMGGTKSTRRPTEAYLSTRRLEGKFKAFTEPSSEEHLTEGNLLINCLLHYTSSGDITTNTATPGRLAQADPKRTLDGDGVKKSIPTSIRLIEFFRELEAPDWLRFGQSVHEEL